MPSVQILSVKPKVVQMQGCNGLRQDVSVLKSSRIVEEDIGRASPDTISTNVQISDSDGLGQVVSDPKSSRATEDDIDRALSTRICFKFGRPEFSRL